MICPTCGAANDDLSRFCSRCRAPLRVAADGRKRTEPASGKIPDRPVVKGPIINGRFRVLRSLGRGGMGEILLAVDVKLGRKVAIKSISASALQEGDSKARFLREAQAASRLDHPNICTIYEIAEEMGREYIVMQYIDGVTLEQLMKVKPLSLEKIIDIATQIADGMTAAQSRNIVHRDIKPGNIMIDRNGHVKILDFGLAKICGTADPCEEQEDRVDRDLTEKGIVMGTASYMSPEQVRGQKLDSRSDVFSYGVVLYEMIENRNPFAADENIVTLYNILHHELRFSGRVPAALRAIVRKAVQKDRGRRYSDFQEIKQDLAEFQAELARAKKLPLKGDTEVIAANEQIELLRASERVSPASDGENLSSMVRRLKNMKASTETLRTGRSRRLWLAGAVLLLLAALISWLALVRPGRPAGVRTAARPDLFNVLLFPFENQTPDKRIGAEVNYLLQAALNQFAGFKVLDEKTLSDLNGGAAILPGQLPGLNAKYAVRYVLRGKLSSVADKFSIEASLGRVDGSEHRPPFFIPGKEKNSLLTDQVDNLARRIQQAVMNGRAGASLEPAKIAAMFGSDWPAFDMFFQGLALWNRKQFGPARQFLSRADSQAAGMPAARYHLALLADYTGSAGEALGHLRALIPQLPRFSRPFQLQIQALKAKFDFDFPEQIRCLRELKAMFPFSKEASLELGEAYFRRGDAAHAIPEYDAALVLDQNYAAALNHLGYCYSYLGRHAQAIECFERYRDIDRTANSYDSLGDGYFYLGDYTQSENSKIFAVSLDGSMDWPYLTIADIHVLRANFQAALKSLATYQKLAAYPKAQADALAKKAFISYLQGEYPAALNLLSQALLRHDSDAISEHSAESHWLKGLCQLGLGDLGAARSEYRWLRALCDNYRLASDNFDPALKFCLHLEAMIAEKEGRPQRTREIFQSLLAMKTQLSFWITYYNYQFFLNDYCEFLLRHKDYAAAREALSKCLAFNPGYPPALWSKVALLRAEGNEEPRDVLRRIAAIYGPGPERNFWRRRLAAGLGEQ